MAAKPPREEIKKGILAELGFSKASDVIESFRNRRVYFVKPLSLALSTARVDPKTGLPGFPAGGIFEVAGSPGKGKTSCWEHAVIEIHRDNPKNEVAILQFESFDDQRFQNLQNIGLDNNRVNMMDYSSADMETAENGLNMLLTLAAHQCKEDRDPEDPEIVACIIDSFGAMGVTKEIYQVNKQGKVTDELKGVDTTPQMAIRAQIITRFINQWITLDPNKRPQLWIINHMKKQMGQEDFSTRQLNPEKVGEDLNLTTLGGVGFIFHCDLRIRADARKWPPNKDAEVHPIFENKIQDGLEVFYEVYRNRYFPGKKMCKGILDFSDRRNVRWDLEDEVISYASYLEIDGICSKGQGRYLFPKLGASSYYASKCAEYLRENQDYMWELIREIAKQPEKLFKVSKKAPEKL